MTEEVITPEKLEEFVRERFDRILVSSCTNSSKRFHLPSDEEWMRPICLTDNKRDKWIDKSISVYPPGFHPVCKRCAKERFGFEVTDE